MMAESREPLWLDPYIVGRYWSAELTELALKHEAPSPETGWIDRAWDEKFSEALGLGASELFWFEVHAANAFGWEFKKDIFCRQGSSIHQQFARRIKETGKPYSFPTRYPKLHDIPDSSLIDVPEERRARKSSDFRCASDSCSHQRLRHPSSPVSNSRPKHSRHAACRLVFRVPRTMFDQTLSFTSLPACLDCGAAVVCSCVESEVLRYVGDPRGALDLDSLPNDCCGDIGFRSGICDLCNPAARLSEIRAKTGAGRQVVIENSNIVTDDLDGLAFRNLFAAMLGIRKMLAENPAHYVEAFETPPVDPDAHLRRSQAFAFSQLLDGRQTAVVVGEYQRAFAPNHRAEELWRHYFLHGRNQFRKRHGLPEIGSGWVREMSLLRVVRDVLTDVLVLHQARPAWLENLTLDIYVPSMAIAFEHQGEQHFRPVEHFGGERAFASLKERDARKAKLCHEHGVRLIYVTMEDEISRDFVRRQMSCEIV